MKKKKQLTDEQKGYTQGLWYAIEQLVIEWDKPTIAKRIIKESGIEEWEFRQNLEETGYEKEILGKFLDEIFGI